MQRFLQLIQRASDQLRKRLNVGNFLKESKLLPVELERPEPKQTCCRLVENAEGIVAAPTVWKHGALGDDCTRNDGAQVELVDETLPSLVQQNTP